MPIEPLVIQESGMSRVAGACTVDLSPMQALLLALDELKAMNALLVANYRSRLSQDPPGPRVRRWQSRTLSALRAAERANVKTAASIRKVKRRMIAEGMVPDEHRR